MTFRLLNTTFWIQTAVQSLCLRQQPSPLRLDKCVYLLAYIQYIDISLYIYIYSLKIMYTYIYIYTYITQGLILFFNILTTVLCSTPLPYSALLYFSLLIYSIIFYLYPSVRSRDLHRAPCNPPTQPPTPRRCKIGDCHHIH